MPEISSDELGTGNWTDIGLKNTAIDNATYQGSAYAYYDSESRRIIFMADNLQKGTPGQIDTNDLQVQVVMRVTNPDNIIGNSASYTNTAASALGARHIKLATASKLAAPFLALLFSMFFPPHHHPIYLYLKRRFL